MNFTNGIPDDLIASETVVAAIVAAIYKRDVLSVVNDVYADFNDLLNGERSANETFKNYKARFDAQVSKLSAHGKSGSIHKSLLAMMLPAGSLVGESQRVLILPADGGLKAFNADQDSDAILAAIEYKSVASVRRQCDSSFSASSTSHGSFSSLSVNNASCGSALRRNSRRNNNKSYSSNWNDQTGQSQSGRPRMTPAKLHAYKLKCICNACNMRRYWQSDHKSRRKYQRRAAIASAQHPLPPNIPQNAVFNANDAASNNGMRKND